MTGSGTDSVSGIPFTFGSTSILETSTFSGGHNATASGVALDVAPIPPTSLLMGSGILGLVGIGWRRRKAS